MRRDFHFFIICLCLTACVAAKPMVIQENDRTVSQLGGFQFWVPDGFKVVETVDRIDAEGIKDSMVIMVRAVEGEPTVIVFSMQEPHRDYVFKKIPLKTIFPQSIVHTEKTALLSEAVSYPAAQPLFRPSNLARRLVCMTFTGHHYAGSAEQYRIDIFQPFRVPIEGVDKAPIFLNSMQEDELKRFHEKSLAWVEAHLKKLK